MPAPTFVPAVFYKDPIAALKWLERVFGFEISSLVTDAQGQLAHSEMSFHGGVLNIGGEWQGAIVGPARMRSPATVEGVNTQFVRVHLDDGLDAHFAHAKAQGANITAEPEDQFYGARTYRVVDPEGHVWNFSQDVRVVSAQEMEQATGLKIHATLDEAGHG
ncbi:VOC family protein [Phenylobacterium sp.]|uniref:VOC family protein n=1 Tax=Phenylobacterium sp. TaxID=1871053 RepID=UPI002DF36597|nr:VOC family protein [Phenylobacterium sp.]